MVRPSHSRVEAARASQVAARIRARYVGAGLAFAAAVGLIVVASWLLASRTDSIGSGLKQAKPWSLLAGAGIMVWTGVARLRQARRMAAERGP